MLDLDFPIRYLEKHSVSEQIHDMQVNRRQVRSSSGFVMINSSRPALLVKVY